MFNVLIADDEESVIQTLREGIDWKSLGLTVAAAAQGGLQALEKIKEKDIDIAILDIRMPGLSGLELCQRLQGENRHIQMIIVSGYAEFAYAEKAIQYGVIGYCLKPVDYLQMTRYLRKAISNIKSAKNILEQEDLLEILEKQDGREIRRQLKKLGFPEGHCYVAITVGERKLEELSRGGAAFRLGRGQWGYLLKKSEIETIEKCGDGKCLGIGYINRPLEGDEIYHALEDCRAYAYQYFVDGKTAVCTEADDNRAGQWIEKVQREVRNNRWERVVSILRKIKEKGMQDFTARSAQRLCNLVFSMSIFRDEESDYYVYNIEQLVSEYTSFAGMIETLLPIIENAGEEQGKTDFTNSAFMKLMRYINENYKGNISLTSAAQALYMNPNYVSQMFKKETGVTFVHYVTQKRIEDAKTLLVATQKPLADIAVEVGFNDYFHFIKTFKKFTEMTPSQYRNQN